MKKVKSIESHLETNEGNFKKLIFLMLINIGIIKLSGMVFGSAVGVLVISIIMIPGLEKIILETRKIFSTIKSTIDDYLLSKVKAAVEEIRKEQRNV